MLLHHCKQMFIGRHNTRYYFLLFRNSIFPHTETSGQLIRLAALACNTPSWSVFVQHRAIIFLVLYLFNHKRILVQKFRLPCPIGQISLPFRVNFFFLPKSSSSFFWERTTRVLHCRTMLRRTMIKMITWFCVIPLSTSRILSSAPATPSNSRSCSRAGCTP